MIRAYILVEGQTEETFINRVLAYHFGQFNIVASARKVETSRDKGRIYRGGLIDYQRVRKDLSNWMKEDKNSDVYFTTMFDLYALPKDFPGYNEANKQNDPYKRVAMLETFFVEDIRDPRFIPYIQIHEFEALLFTDPSKFDWEFLEHEYAIKELVKISEEFVNPELIDDHPDTAPSKRICAHIPEYASRKPLFGPNIAEKIGIATMRAKCPHFDDWLKKIEALAQ